MRVSVEPFGLDAIRQAAELLRGQVLETPCLASRTLSDIAGCGLWLKFENLQFTASFKERGALNKIAQLRDDERARGVLAVSAGTTRKAWRITRSVSASPPPSSCRGSPRR